MLYAVNIQPDPRASTLFTFPPSLSSYFFCSLFQPTARTQRNNFGTSPVPKRGYGTEEYSEETLADLIAQLESTQKEVSQVTIWYLSLTDRIHWCCPCLIQRRFKDSMTSNIALHCHVKILPYLTSSILLCAHLRFPLGYNCWLHLFPYLRFPLLSFAFLHFPPFSLLFCPTAWCRGRVD